MGLGALTAITALSGLVSARQQRRAGRDALRASRENAERLIATTHENIGLGLEAAEFNALAVEALGEYNASAIESAAAMNAELMGIEGVEKMRQHIMDERRVGGTIRAMAASSGLSVNEGTPAHYYNFQVSEMLHSRKYLAEVTTTSILNYLEQEQTRADLVRFESGLRADTARYNAQIEAAIALNDAEMQAEAMISNGQAMNSAARIQSYSTLLNTAVGVGQIYAGYGTPSVSQSGWQSSMALMSPYGTTPGYTTAGNYTSPIRLSFSGFGS